MPYFIDENVYTSIVDGNVLILDLKTNKYLALDCRNKPDLLAAVDSAARDPHRELRLEDALGNELEKEISDLIAHGVLTQRKSERRRAHFEFDLPTGSLISGPPAAPGWVPPRALLWFFAAFISMCFRLKVLGLRNVVEYFEATRSGAELNSQQEISRAEWLVRTFCRIRPWVYTAHEKCLFDSIILTRFLRLHGYAARFVIGTHPLPFSAHAWVQIGDRVADDTVEVIRAYRPILTA
ncbi:MAG TPA: lasso peptide biosynthesis B2 protein [Steroidobacteraceae bacterium]|nr:lasso peptide biosynthesis B2 protein [Steroidobacteraceae bacterium]